MLSFRAGLDANLASAAWRSHSLLVCILAFAARLILRSSSGGMEIMSRPSLGSGMEATVHQVLYVVKWG